MQAQINPSLQALLQTAQMVTPEQGPTVAKQVAQAAMQKMQAAPPGIEALLPGVQQQAAQSAQAAQPATQGDVNQLRQMMSQMAPQGQGISAGADVRMAEGGIVGYNGEEGSQVKTQAGKDLSVNERFALLRKRLAESGVFERPLLDSLAAAMGSQFVAPSPERAPVPAEAPEASYSNESRIGLASKPVPVTVPTAPAPSAPRRVAPKSAVNPAETGIAATMLPDTRESTAVNPSEAALLNAQMQGKLNDLRESLSRKPAESEAEKAYRAAAMAEYQRGLGGIDAARQRMTESQQKQKDMDFINYLSGMGGGRSLFAGMRQSGQALSQAQQQREASRLAYEDKLEDRRNIVENLKLATLRQDAESARAWTNELRKNEVEISKLSIDLSKDRAGQLAIAEREREKTAATAREGELGRASQERIAELNRQAQAALRNLPGPEQQMIERAIKSLQDANPGMPYHEAYDKVRGAGRGITERQDVNELKALIASLRDQADPMKNMDKASREQASVLLRQAQEKLAQMSGLAPAPAGGASAAPRGTRENPIKLD